MNVGTEHFVGGLIVEQDKFGWLVGVTLNRAFAGRRLLNVRMSGVEELSIGGRVNERPQYIVPDTSANASRAMEMAQVCSDSLTSSHHRHRLWYCQKHVVLQSLDAI